MNQSTRVALLYVFFFALFAVGFEVVLGVPRFSRASVANYIYEDLVWEPYSDAKRDRALAEGKTVLVVLRSPHSFWSPKYFPRLRLSKHFDLNNLILLDLVWQWHQPKGEAKQYFEKFGFTKMAVVVQIERGGSSMFWR